MMCTMSAQSLKSKLEAKDVQTYPERNLRLRTRSTTKKLKHSANQASRATSNPIRFVRPHQLPTRTRPKPCQSIGNSQRIERGCRNGSPLCYEDQSAHFKRELLVSNNLVSLNPSPGCSLNFRPGRCQPYPCLAVARRMKSPFQET